MELARFGRVLDRIRHQFARHEHCVAPDRPVGGVTEQMTKREPRTVGRCGPVLEIENEIRGRHARRVPTLCRCHATPNGAGTSDTQSSGGWTIETSDPGEW